MSSLSSLARQGGLTVGLLAGSLAALAQTAPALNTVAGVAGTRQPNTAYVTPADKSKATATALYNTYAAVADAQGNVYFTDFDQKNPAGPSANIGRVYKVTPAGEITTVAGAGSATTSGDGGPATAANMNRARGLALTADGKTLYVAEQAGKRIRKVDLTTGTISTYAGSGKKIEDGIVASKSRVLSPMGLALDKDDNLFIADESTHSIRRVDAKTGLISTVAGTSESPGFGGDGGPATSAQLKGPRSVAVAANGDLYVADYGNNVVRKVDAKTGTISTVVGTYSETRPSSGGNGGPASAATLAGPGAVAVDAQGNLYVGEGSNIRRVDKTTNVITTYAGGGSSPTAADGSLPTAAKLSAGSLYIVGDRLYFSDGSGAVIRVITDKSLAAGGKKSK